jgi:hypothetical protein
MIQSGIDQDALIEAFAQASAKQGERLRKMVSEVTLKGLQGRELTLENVGKVLKTVTQAASAGAARNPAGAVDVEALLGQALAGRDAALLQAVEAQRKAVQQFVDARQESAGGLGAAKAMMDSYATLVGGVLAGISEGMQPAEAPAAKARRK